MQVTTPESQGSVLFSLLFNIYIHDLPVRIARKFAYADGLALNTKLENIRRDFNSGHGNDIFVPPEMEAKAQYSRNDVGCLLLQ